MENSIVHGFNKQSSGVVAVYIGRAEEALQIIIDDNGAGLKQHEERPRKRHTGGYGIRNVRERIAGYFGNGYGVTLKEREAGGTRVEVILPLLTEAPGQRLSENRMS